MYLVTDYTYILEKYTLYELIELNNLDPEDVLEYLVDQDIIILPVVL